MKSPKKNFNKIYDENIGKIYRFIFFKVNSKDIAEDLCSETFLRFWKIFREDQEKIENSQAFLYRVARNLVIDHYKEKSRTQIIPVEAVLIQDPKIDIEEGSYVSSDIEVIKSALIGLKEEYNEMIAWYYIDDLSISEISELANKSEGAVRVTIHRALNSLKKVLEENGTKEV